MRLLTRYIYRRTHHHTTRMLGGAPRPRPPDEIALYCRAMRRILEIDKTLVPFLREQQRIHDDRLFRRECEAALAKIYGLQLPL